MLPPQWIPCVLCLALASMLGCFGSPPEQPEGSGGDECRLEADEEPFPGYPFDLDTFAKEILPNLKADCATSGCHAPPEGQLQFTVWPEAEKGNCDYVRTFRSLEEKVDLLSPSNSAVYVAVSGDNPRHPFTYPEGDPKLEALLAFLEQAAETQGEREPPPPGASPFDYQVFAETIQPILDSAEAEGGCAIEGCHGSAAGSFRLHPNPAPDSQELEENFLAVTRRANLDNVESSLFYLKATTRHGAGSSRVVSSNQAGAILDWITKAADVSGGDGLAGCVPVERFHLPVFRDEVLPMLRGDVNYNDPTGDTLATGCTRGPCHGTERGPGTLYLEDSLTAEENLRNFSCFVNATNPSASPVITCPLDDPRCKVYPHPGDAIFSGAEDRNFQKLLGYLYGTDSEATPLDFAFFVRRINPIFNDPAVAGPTGQTCADTGGCHGVSAAGQPPPNGSNFPILPNATDEARLSFNFVSASNFAHFLDPEESSLFLYPTNEIVNVEEHAFATGLPHPGGATFQVDSEEARAVLEWAGGLRPDSEGFVRYALVAGDYPATNLQDSTVVDEANVRPRIFDSSGAPQFNGGQWDGLFAEGTEIDLGAEFPREQATDRVAYAVLYLINTTGATLPAVLEVSSENAVLLYVGDQPRAQSEDGDVTAFAELPPFSGCGGDDVGCQGATRVLIKVLQRSGDPSFGFSLRLKDDLGNPLTDRGGELLIKLGPEGGI